jgi:hypothetical protein
MNTRSENIENLLKIGQLKEAARDEALLRSHLEMARVYQKDATIEQSSVPTRFTAAYEGIHQLCIATLLHFGVRTDGDGHRSAALQLAFKELNIDAGLPGATAVIIKLHKLRNETTYLKPHPPASEKDLAGAVLLLDLVLTEFRKLTGI